MKYEEIKQFVGKYVRVYVRGGYHEGVLCEDVESPSGSGFHMNERIECYVSKIQTISRRSSVPLYFSSIEGIKKIEEVNADG